MRLFCSRILGIWLGHYSRVIAGDWQLRPNFHGLFWQFIINDFSLKMRSILHGSVPLSAIVPEVI